MSPKTPVALLAASGLLFVACTACSTSPKSDADKSSLSSSTSASLDGFKAEDPTLQQLLDKAAGWAIFPEVGKAGFVVGGSYGRGEVFEKGKKIGFADIKQATFGLQIGAQTFSELVIFFKNEDIAKFKQGEFSLAANLSAVAIKPGVAGTTDTGKGVVVFVRTSGGLMAEASVGGQVFKFAPL